MFMTKIENWYIAVKLFKHGFCGSRRISVNKILTMCIYIYIYINTHTHTYTTRALVYSSYV
jgi:hypothetical protein